LAATPQVQAPGCALRLFWIAIGNGFLLFFASRVYMAGSFSLFDLAYWATAAAMAGARYIDVFRFHGATTSGEAATPEHFRRYALGLGGGAIVLWGLVHASHLI
jgi:hypothetical protein